MKSFFAILAFSLLCVSCTQISNTYNVTGDCNTIKASDSVTSDKKQDDLLDIAGSAYGDATMQGADK